MLEGHPEASNDDAQAVEGDEETNETANEGTNAWRAGAVAIDDGAATALTCCTCQLAASTCNNEASSTELCVIAACRIPATSVLVS